jgi:hypothetical protein
LNGTSEMPNPRPTLVRSNSVAITLLIVLPEELFSETKHIIDSIAVRAYELFESRGDGYGHAAIGFVPSKRTDEPLRLCVRAVDRSALVVWGNRRLRTVAARAQEGTTCCGYFSKI